MRALAAFAIALLAACSTDAVTRESAQPVSPNRIYRADMLEPRLGSASVLFLRDSGMLGAGCTHDISVNGQKAFSIGAAEFAELRLAPGKYLFTLETGRGICPNVAASQTSELAEGAAETYRILTPSTGGVRLTRVK